MIRKKNWQEVQNFIIGQSITLKQMSEVGQSCFGVVIQWLAPIGPLIIPREWTRDRLWLMWSQRTVKWLIRQATGEKKPSSVYDILGEQNYFFTFIKMKLLAFEDSPLVWVPSQTRKVENPHSCLWCTESSHPKRDQCKLKFFFRRRRDCPTDKGTNLILEQFSPKTGRQLNK